ncbi:MAG: FAD-dependent oxidoreductase, partial [Planctomycetota bacterium]
MTNTNSTYDLVCIGSGPAGQRGAIQAAKLGKRVAIIERRAHIGGVCLGTGTIPSKTFREAVLTLTAAQADGHSGTQSKRPSAAQLLDRVGEVMQREAEVVETQLTRNDVEMIRGEASFVDPHTLRVVDGTASRNLHADNVLLCVGTNPTRPENISDPSGVILTSDDICHLQRVPRTLTVVGAGVIGLEYASMFGRLGVEVTVIDRRPRPLEFLDVEIVDELIHQMRNTSVVFRPNETVSSIEVATEPKARAVVNLESGKRVVSEMVLFAIGRTGATRKLGLENAGLEADERGRLTVDDGYRTSVPHIFAAGDVIGYPSLAATSSEQGRRAICTAFDHGARPMSPNFPI